MAITVLFLLDPSQLIPIMVERTNEGLIEVPNGIADDAERIYLQDNQITAIRECDFCSFFQLTLLNLDDNDISSVSPTAFNYTTLETLTMNGNNLPLIPDLAVIGNTLSRLELYHNHIDSIADGTFQALSILDRLTLEGNQLNEANMGQSCFDGLTGLRYLYLQDNELTG